MYHHPEINNQKGWKHISTSYASLPVCGFPGHLLPYNIYPMPITPVILLVPPGRRGRSPSGGGATCLGPVGTWVSRLAFVPPSNLYYPGVNVDAVI